MPSFRLRLSVPARLTAAEAAGTLLWSREGRDSFVTRLGPSLGDLGPVPRPNIELVRLAAAVFAADRSALRRGGGSNWSRRDIRVSVPVFEAERWLSISDRLAALLGFLSGDDWQLRFVRARSPREPINAAIPRASRVVLLSGGADSAIGALMARDELAGEPCALVSHVGATNLSPIQQDVASLVESLLPGGPQRHVQIRFSRGSKRVDGSSFANEYSTRTRSLLFLALGLAVASVDGVELLVPENGFASLNPPLGPDQRGSLSTRTTHPAFLSGLSELLAEAGAHAVLRNPFEDLTKGAMFRQAADLIGNGQAAALLSSTHSCAHTGHRSFGLPVRYQCGICFGCLLRRSAFLASGLADTTDYLCSMSDPHLAGYLADKSMERPVREFLDRGIRPTDVAALSLPPAYPGRMALDLCRRTIAELRLLWP